MVEIKAQVGPQEQFISSTANIAIFGGASGGGKSYGLLLEPLRHYKNSKFGAVIFRRTTSQVRNEGGLWDEATSLYSQIGAQFRESALEVVFKTGMHVKFAHLEYDKDVYSWQGSQIPFIGFDELTHFTEKQFFYMLSRNRSMSGVPGYIRATTNPSSSSWVRKFIDWWINKDTGFPIKDRAGVLRYFVRQDDEIVWADSKEELVTKFGDGAMPKSVTFIPSSIFDNKILMEKDPTYLASLKALARVERMQLLEGNWNVEAGAGMYFKRDWFEIIDALPIGHIKAVRYWDRGATAPHEGNKDPDWTAGVKLLKYRDGSYVVSDVRRIQDSPLAVERLIKNIATQDGHSVLIGIEQDPGSAGVADAQNFVRLLAGYAVRVRKVTKDKQTRSLPVSAQCEAGNIKVLRAPWNDAFFSELENFPEGAHDDQCLTAGTKISTVFGDKNIEDINVGDYVLTPLGPQKVVAAQKTGMKRVIAHNFLDGTSSHPVFQHGYGFKNLDISTSVFNDYLSCHSLIRWAVQNQFFLMASNTAEWAGKDYITSVSQVPIPAEKSLKDYMLLFMSAYQKHPFLKVMKFTTKIVIHLIITLVIWSVYRAGNIAKNINLKIPRKCEGIYKKLGFWPPNGIDPKRVVSGIRFKTRAESILIEILNVLNVGLRSWQSSHLPDIAPQSVMKNLTIMETNGAEKKDALFAKSHLSPSHQSILQKQKPAQDFVREEWVYNLTVEKAHSYYANGILVGNCDSFSGCLNELCETPSILSVL